MLQVMFGIRLVLPATFATVVLIVTGIDFMNVSFILYKFIKRICISFIIRLCERGGQIFCNNCYHKNFGPRGIGYGIGANFQT